MSGRKDSGRDERGWLSAVLRGGLLLGLPLGLLAFLNLTRVQWNLPLDGPSHPHYGFPWRACAPGANSLSLEIAPLALLGNLGVYLAVALAVAALPPLRRLARLPILLVLLLWLAVAVSAGFRSLDFLIGDLTLTDDVGTITEAGLRDQRPAFAFCSSNRSGP